MAAGGFTHGGLAPCGPDWRILVAALAIALVGATSGAAVWHEEHAGDQDCAVCQLRHQPAVALPVSIQIGSMDTPELLIPAPHAGWGASGHISRLLARAPPA